MEGHAGITSIPLKFRLLRQSMGVASNLTEPQSSITARSRAKMAIGLVASAFSLSFTMFWSDAQAYTSKAFRAKVRTCSRWSRRAGTGPNANDIQNAQRMPPSSGNSSRHHQKTHVITCSPTSRRNSHKGRNLTFMNPEPQCS